MYSEIPSLRILVDMDGVLADFNGSVTQQWSLNHPELETITADDHTNFDIDENYRRLYGDWAVDEIADIYTNIGFTANITPVEGAIDAVKEMIADGHEVFICTSPMLESYHHQLNEKYDWVRQYFGIDQLNRLILTKDKTVIIADILIDDKPHITGLEKIPTWTHILFDQAYNRHITNKNRLVNWVDWRKTITDVYYSQLF